MIFYAAPMSNHATNADRSKEYVAVEKEIEKEYVVVEKEIEKEYVAVEKESRLSRWCPCQRPPQNNEACSKRLRRASRRPPDAHYNQWRC